MLPGLKAMAWFLAVAMMPQEHCGKEACTYVRQGDWRETKQMTAGFEEANSSCATGFESHGAWFEAELTGCFTGSVDEETEQGFEAFGHHVGDCSAWRRKTVEHEKDYELDKWTLIVEQLKALSIVDRLNIDALRSSCRIAGTLIGGTLSNIASRLSLAGRLNSWVEIEETDGQVAHENTGHLVNQSIGEKLDQEHGQETDSMAVYTLDEERMCLTFEDKRKTDWEGSTQEFGALQLMNKTVQALFQQVNKLLQQVPDAGTVQKLAEAFSQRLWQEMSMIRSWTAWTISLIAAWLMSHLSRCKHRQSRTERKVFARTKQVRRRQLRASLFASWLRCGRAMDQEMFMKMAAMTEAATKAATAAEVALASLAGGTGGASSSSSSSMQAGLANGFEDPAQS